jgi:hypothetical protein
MKKLANELEAGDIEEEMGKLYHLINYFFSCLFICPYIVWTISPPCPSPAPPTPSLPGRNCSTLMSNFVAERV